MTAAPDFQNGDENNPNNPGMNPDYRPEDDHINNNDPNINQLPEACVETDAVAIPIVMVDEEMFNDSPTVISGMTQGTAPNESSATTTTSTSVATAKQCTVIAPQTLHEGYVFTAVVDGIEFDVTVPQGGVVEGQRFQVPYPARPPSVSATVASTAPPPSSSYTTTSDSIAAAQNVSIPSTSNPPATAPNAFPNLSSHAPETNPYSNPPPSAPPIPDEVVAPTTPATTTTSAPATTTTTTTAITTIAIVPANTVPVNKPSSPGITWNYELFDCFEVVGNGVFWNAWCCTPVLYGQLAQRMKLNPLGIPSQTAYKYTFYVLLGLWAFNLLMLFIIGFSALYWLSWIYFLIVATNIRYAYRQKYDIEEKDCSGCDGRMEDFCCGMFCACCSSIQMARQTHDLNEYNYQCCGPTGLPTGAPEIV